MLYQKPEILHVSDAHAHTAHTYKQRSHHLGPSLLTSRFPLAAGCLVIDAIVQSRCIGIANSGLHASLSVSKTNVLLHIGSLLSSHHVARLRPAFSLLFAAVLCVMDGVPALISGGTRGLRTDHRVVSGRAT